MAKPRARRTEVRTASKTTRRLFELMDLNEVSMADLSADSGIHLNTLYFWRSGKAAATIFNMEAALQTMGLELVIQPIKQDEPA